MESTEKNRSRNDPFYALMLENLRGANAGDVKSHRWVVDHLCASKIKSAGAGDVESGKWLLRQFCATVTNNRRAQGQHTQFNEELLDHILDAFTKILDGVPSNRALGIAKDKGRPAIEDKFHRDVKICAEVLKHHKSDERKTIEASKEEATNSLGISRDIVDRAWKNKVAKEVAKDFPESDWI